MNPTSEQKIAIQTQGRALLVEAGAGTGKTWVLVQRFLHLLSTNPGWDLESITAITFTEKAAREMRTRLRREIETRYRQEPDHPVWSKHWLDLDRLQVGTIHSLCARMLRENAIALGLDPYFQVLDEQEAGIVKEQAIEETIRTLQQENHPALELLASLRVMDLRSQMAQMLAMRGTLYAIFDKLADPETLLADWQTGFEAMRQSIWDELLERNPELAFALEQLPYTQITDPEDKLSVSVQLAKQGCQCLADGDLVEAADCWLQIVLNVGAQSAWGGKEALKDLKAQLRAVRDAAINLDKANVLKHIDAMDETAAQHLHLWRSLWEKLEQIYSQIKDAQQALDFDDLEILAERLLHQDPRPERLQASLDGMQHLMVDEFQDTNLVQQRIVYALAPIEQPGKLFLVGDAKQSIYRFRQAQVSGFNQTAARIKEFTSENAASLSTSFRTHHSLVQAINDLFNKLLQPEGKRHADYEARPGALLAQRQSIDELKNPLEMLLLRQKDLADQKISAEEARIWEAQWIAQRLIQLKEEAAPVWDKAGQCYRPFEFRDAAVLFRATTNFPLYEAEFKKAGLPYLTVSGRGYYDRQEVQDLISLLSALANPLDDLSLAASLRSPLFSLNDETLIRLRWHTPQGELSDSPIHLKDALANPPASAQAEWVARAAMILERLWSLVDRVDTWQLLRTALDLTGFEIVLAQNDGEHGRQRANLSKFLSLARERGGASISAFLSRLQDLKAIEAREGEALGREPESGAVQLMSIHAAKGLEFPVVVAADLGRQKRRPGGSAYLLHDPVFGVVCKVRDEQGEWQEPAGYAWGKWLYQQMEKAEEKRLLYVACTRAADRLILTGQVGNSDSWLQQILEAYEIDADGPQDELLQGDSFGIRILRPDQPEEIRPVEGGATLNVPGMQTIPPLARPLPLQPLSPSVAVTHLGFVGLRVEQDVMDLQPAILTGKDAKVSHRAPGYLIGEIVHRALAHWKCLSYGDQELLDFLEKAARRSGVQPQTLMHAVRISYGMLANLKRHPLYKTVQAAPQVYREVPFSLKAQGRTLHGVIDLLYQDAQGSWHVLDWKTEWTPGEKVAEKPQEHRLQMAIYAKAVENQLGVIPEVSLCFLSPRVQECNVDHDMIREALSGFGE